MTVCFLRMGDDYLEDATRCHSIRDAIEEYREVAEELNGYEQKIEASIHIAKTMDEVAEYPDYVLSLGPRGGVKVETT